jgi:signal peptidase I
MHLTGTTRAVVETVVTLAVALLIAYLGQAFIVKPYRVPSGSMLPTLEPGDRVLADRISLRFTKPHRGQIVVFHPPSCVPAFSDQGVCTVPDFKRRTGYSDTTFIKRVIGLPGDTVTTRDDKIWIEPPGKPAFKLDEPYVHGAPTTRLGTVKVKPGYYLLLGDNRTNSDDSRMWGQEKASEIIGVARARYWPIPRIGRL